jgi:hypothetical protein
MPWFVFHVGSLFPSILPIISSSSQTEAISAGEQLAKGHLARRATKQNRLHLWGGHNLPEARLADLYFGA